MGILTLYGNTDFLYENTDSLYGNIFLEIFDEPCKFDYLQIKDGDTWGTPLGKFCGNSIPHPIISTEKSLWVNMITDSDDTRAGFRASWELLEAEQEGECKTLLLSTNGEESHYQ